ncbi:MAG: pyruvate ferredoxin oxidoreductase subunit gamma [Candidatus Altiarchaeota archaeon]|nr:pyruvate ferredoxin oxidoreductase subunit gamma [Candidatus Altiarchaeota archaeon]
MKEIRFHGRGGQGAVTAATLLAIAAFKDGRFSQAFPKFGVERRGAPVEAFTRISDRFIRRKNAVYEPDILVVLDSTLFDLVNVTDGLAKGGQVIINTEKKPEEFNIGGAEVSTVDATSLAFEILGLDIVNTSILGAFAAFTGEVRKESLCEAVRENFPQNLAEKNVELVERTYDKLIEGER